MQGPGPSLCGGNKFRCICILIFHINKGPERACFSRIGGQNLIRNEKFIGSSLMRLMHS